MAVSKSISALTCIVILLGGLSFTLRSIKKADKPEGFAIVELFTSEGCSSCPPADELIAKIQKENAGKPVYILAFHVDYWNRLGWKDQFSSAAFSQRQRKYADWLNLSSVYTPQAVINGRKEFVGSAEGNLRNSIKNALLKPSASTVTLSNLRISGGNVTVHYKVDGEPENSSLLIALVQKNAVTKVLRGENRGSTLSHVQIVKNIQSTGLKGNNSGNVTLSLPADIKEKLELIAFVQRNNNGEITAGTRTALGSHESSISNALK